jgi:hypothetical protein
LVSIRPKNPAADPKAQEVGKAEPPEQILPTSGPIGHFLDRFIVKHVAPKKHGDHHPDDPAGPNMVTQEWVLGPPLTVKTPFGTFNMNASDLHTIRPQKGKGTELIQVTDWDGTPGVETVVWRMPIWKGWRIELQTLGVYGGPGGLPIPLHARFIGIGLTRDKVDEKSKEALSVTLEYKLTDGDVGRLAGLVAPGVASAVAEAVKGGAESGAAAIVGELLAGAVPIVSGLIAISTARWALKTLKDPNATKTDKAFAVAPAVADAARVVFPIAGTVANVALVGASLGLKWWQHRKEKREAQPAAPPTGPPEAEPSSPVIANAAQGVS